MPSAPTQAPSRHPTAGPTAQPTRSPSKSPTGKPSLRPSNGPSVKLTETPSTTPTLNQEVSLSILTEVVIVPDFYPSETSWTIASVDQDLVTSGLASGASIKLPPGLYTFEMFDKYGDGICCSYGHGSYSLRVAGVEVYSGGTFGKTTGEQWFTIDGDGDGKAVAAPSAAPSGSPSNAPVAEAGPGLVPGLQPSCQRDDHSAFNICYDIAVSGEVSKGWEESFVRAKNTWERIITHDTPSIRFNQPSSSSIVATELPNQIDDIYVAINAQQIDGVGGVLGMAGPTRIARKNGKLMPITGIMIFDTSDIDNHVEKGTFDGIVLHELGHVLGIGTLWTFPPSLYDGSIYSGERANAEFRSISGMTRTVPIEKDGGSGTAHGHFDEACLGNELMTGYLSPDMKTSRITLGALQDLGYVVDMTEADDFEMPENANCHDDDRRELRAGKGVHQLGGGPQRVLSEGGRAKALAYGNAVLEKSKADIFLYDQSVADDEEILDVGTGHYSVLFFENDTVFEVEV
mmetsp:Transcript_15026/g.32745  ORF Transcript_15026/g.32745 Transcript_15026/m.32745 type:complete len:516 (-) Transcript_15026:68-1615(-)